MSTPNLIVSFLLLFYIPLFGQTKIDNNISIEIPGNVQKMDTTTASTSVSAYYSNNKTDSYLVLRIAVMSDGYELYSLPENLSSVKQIYHQIIADQINSMNRKGFAFKDSQEVKIKGYLAYKIRYKTEDSSNQGGETLLLYLNGVTYVFTYSRVDYFIEKHKHRFLNSLTISNSPKQITDAQSGFGFLSLCKWFFNITIIIWFFYILRRKENRKISKWGINLKAVYCPICNTKQQFFRIPKNKRQLLWGGNTCPKCGTEMDKYGVVINSDN